MPRRRRRYRRNPPKSDFDIKDQVAFNDEGRVRVGRIIHLGERTATVQVWNTGDYEVAYARLELRKKKKRRKSPSKATKELRAATGSKTAVARKAPKKVQEPDWAALGLPAEGLIDLGIPEYEPAPPPPAPKRKGKKAPAKKAAPKKGTRKAAIARSAKKLQAKGPAVMQEKIGKVLNKLYIRKAEDREAVTAIAEAIIADEGFSAAAVQSAAIVHFGERKDAPQWLRKMDRKTRQKFYKKYTVRGGQVQKRGDVARAGGKVKIKPFKKDEKFADYVHRTWGGWENYLWSIWPEVSLNTAEEKARFRALDQRTAEKFIPIFERAMNNKTTPHTTASAFDYAMDKVGENKKAVAALAKLRAKKNPSCDTEGRYAVLIRERGRDHCTFATNNRALANRAAKAMRKKGRNSFVADLGGYRSNPPKRKGKRRPSNRRKLRVGQTVEWTNRRGQRDWGVVHDARGKSATVMSSVTMRFEEHLNKDLYPIKVPKPNPAAFTQKGERMYRHIRDSYASSMGMAKAKEVAARTVYCRAQCAPGLVRA